MAGSRYRAYPTFVSKHARVWCARDIYWVYRHHRGLLSPWQRHVTYGTGRLISIPRGEITIVPFLFGSRLRSPETVGRVLVGRMVITYCQAVALVRPRLMGHSSLFAGCIHINAPRLTEFEAILRRIFFSSSLFLSLSLSLPIPSVGMRLSFSLSNAVFPCFTWKKQVSRQTKGRAAADRPGLDKRPIARL